MREPDPLRPDVGAEREQRILCARIEPFDSFWEAPEQPESGYARFDAFYRANYLARLPRDVSARILVVSCGPGYFIETLVRAGYHDVRGIDSDPRKVALATARGLPCRAASAFGFLDQPGDAFDAIVCEQELNHLTLDELEEFLGLCRRRLVPGGRLVVHGLNGANPITGAEALAQNVDHFHTFTEYSLRQILEHGGFVDVQVFALRLYVFWRNPLNYAGWFATTLLETSFRLLFRLYGKSNRLFSKKIGAVATLGT